MKRRNWWTVSGISTRPHGDGNRHLLAHVISEGNAYTMMNSIRQFYADTRMEKGKVNTYE